MYRCLSVFFAFLSLAMMVTAQPMSYNFQKITTENGLNISNTTAIAEDKYGYIWIGTNSGLNRFDGYGIKTYEYRHGDSTSVHPSTLRYAYCDSEGRLWFSFMSGFMEFDYAKDCFKEYNKGKMGWVTTILEGKPKHLYVAYSSGLLKLNTETGAMTTFDSLITDGRGWNSQMFDMVKFGRQLYIVGRNGMVTFDLETEKHKAIPLPEGFLPGRIAIDTKGTIWISSNNMDKAPIYRTDTSFKAWKAYYDFEYAPTGLPGRAVDVFIDNQDRLWATSMHEGIALFDPDKDRFKKAPVEPWMPNGVLSPLLGRVFQDKKGFIWAESPKGVCYFDPDNTFFQTIVPDNDPIGINLKGQANDFAERPDGKIWLATWNGIYLYDPALGRVIQHIENQANKPDVLYSNIVFSLLLDRNNNLWAATTKGLNCLRAGQQKFDFLSEKDGVHTQVHMGMVREASDGTIWLSVFNDNGHYYLPPGEKKFRSLKEHPILKPYAGLYGHCFLEDSRKRIWLGLDGRGLVLYDPQKQSAHYWQRTPDNDTTLMGNYVNALAETTDGTIWAATNIGLSSIDPNTLQFGRYARADGMPTNRISTLVADKQNRLWVGTANGLVLIDGKHRILRQMDAHDGLPTAEFTNLFSGHLRDGSLVMPSKRGFVIFNPDQYQYQQQELPFYLSDIRVFNQAYKTETNPEALELLYLPPGKNFFSFEVTALNYNNSRQTWYAYKMEPYDKDWIISRERTANYTNIPGGNYTFRYKVTLDPNNLDVPEKSLKLRVGEHWYVSKWFWGMVILLLSALGYTAFRRRAQLREAFLDLERKAQALSKEKALVQYENLTQQLNPHFLFNSLASLGSLIRFDPKTASEFLEALSRMYRYILQSRDRETVSLAEEIAFVEHFIKLQQTRFGSSLQVNFNIEESTKHFKIVPVTLQNLLENAIKHNILEADSPLIMTIFTEKNYLVVRNNLQRRSVVETSNKQGLSRLTTLYQYLCDKPLVVSETADSFEVRVPLLG